MDYTSQLGAAWLRGALSSRIATDICLTHFGRSGCFRNLSDMLQYIVYLGVRDDNRDVICEIAGGEARCSRLLARSGRVGPNYDLVCGFDLASNATRQHF